MTWQPDEQVSSLASDLIQRRRRTCTEQFREQDTAIARRHSASRTLFTSQVFVELKTALRAAFFEFANGMTTDLVDLVREPDDNVAPEAATWIAEQLDPVLAADSETLVSNMIGGAPHRERLKVDLVGEAQAALDEARRDLKIALGRATLRPRRRATDYIDLAFKDELVKLKNRRGFNEDLARLFAHAMATSAPLALVRIDVDHFKRVNDEHGGHAAGDEVLVAIAGILADCVRGKGDAYRPSGDEFALLLPNHTTAEARAVAERVRETVHAKPVTSRSLRVSVSVGVAVWPDHATDVPGLEQAADEASYDAKNRGRDQVRVFGGTKSALPTHRDGRRT
jgi:diguanylate cyclase (GGDEF)-like protein